jgi:hypothetical protein
MDRLTKVFAEINTLDKSKRVQFYERLAFNLTIGIRSIWANPKTSDVEKIEGMKIINELSHDIFQWIWKLRNKDGEFDDMAVCEQIRSELNDSLVAGEISEALRSSYEHMRAS